MMYYLLYIAGALICIYLLAVNLIAKKKKITVFELEKKLQKYIPKVIAKIVILILYALLLVIYLLVGLGVLFLLIKFVKWAWFF